MSKRNHTQASPQPYTVTRPKRTEEGNVLHVFGYTPERHLQEDESWSLDWEEHDLGVVSTFKIARQVAADWRDGLVGLYPVV